MVRVCPRSGGSWVGGDLTLVALATACGGGPAAAVVIGMPGWRGREGAALWESSGGGFSVFVFVVGGSSGDGLASVGGGFANGRFWILGPRDRSLGGGGSGCFGFGMV